MYTYSLPITLKTIQRRGRVGGVPAHHPPHPTPVRRPRFVSELRSLPIDLSQLTSFYESPRVPSCTCCHDLSAGRWEGYSTEVNAINICYLTTLLLSSLPLRNSYLRNGDLESRFFFQWPLKNGEPFLMNQVECHPIVLHEPIALIIDRGISLSVSSLRKRK